jgi:hypothetical protein
MHITLSPVRMDELLNAERLGDTLVLNGVTVDFTDLPEGEMIEIDPVEMPWIIGPVRREKGEIRLTLLCPHGPMAAGKSAYPKPLHIKKDGPIDLPAD